jgi:hypothetical protein
MPHSTLFSIKLGCPVELSGGVNPRRQLAEVGAGSDVGQQQQQWQMAVPGSHRCIICGPAKITSKTYYK